MIVRVSVTNVATIQATSLAGIRQSVENGTLVIEECHDEIFRGQSQVPGMAFDLANGFQPAGESLQVNTVWRPGVYLDRLAAAETLAVELAFAVEEVKAPAATDLAIGVRLDARFLPLHLPGIEPEQASAEELGLVSSKAPDGHRGLDAADHGYRGAEHACCVAGLQRPGRGRFPHIAAQTGAVSAAEEERVSAGLDRPSVDPGN